MPSLLNSTITNAGAAGIASAMAGTQMTITRVAVGDGVLGATDPTTLTDLISQKMNLTPQPPSVSANNIQNGEIIVFATLDSANVVTTFNFAEMGVFARLAGGAEFLLAYFQQNSPFDSMTHQTGPSRSLVNLSLPIFVGIGASVTVTVVAGNPVFVPPVISPRQTIQVTTPLDGVGRVLEWDIDINTSKVPQLLSSNHTLYVTTTGNDVTGGFDDPTHPFATIQGALNFLNPYFISPGFIITISVAAGVWTSATQINVTHPNGDLIQIIGATPTVGAVTSVTFATGGTVTLNGPAGAFSSINPGDYIGVRLTGLSGSQISGIWICNTRNAGGTSLTYSVVYGSLVGGAPTGSTGSVQALKSVLLFSATGGISVSKNSSLGLLKYFAIRMTGPTAAGRVGFVASGSAVASLDTVGAYGWLTSDSNGTGIEAASGGNVNCTGCWATRCSNCFHSGNSGSLISAGSCYATNGTNGFRSESGGLSISSCFAIGNTVGIGVAHGGSIFIGNSYSYYNSQYGILLSSLSSAAIGPGSFFNAGGNGIDDIALILVSTMTNSGGSIGYTTANLTPNVLSPQGCMFQP